MPSRHDAIGNVMTTRGCVTAACQRETRRGAPFVCPPPSPRHSPQKCTPAPVMPPSAEQPSQTPSCRAAVIAVSMPEFQSCLSAGILAPQHPCWPHYQWIVRRWARLLLIQTQPSCPQQMLYLYLSEPRQSTRCSTMRTGPSSDQSCMQRRQSDAVNFQNRARGRSKDATCPPLQHATLHSREAYSTDSCCAHEQLWEAHRLLRTMSLRPGCARRASSAPPMASMTPRPGAASTRRRVAASASTKPSSSISSRAIGVMKFHLSVAAQHNTDKNTVSTVIMALNRSR